MSESFVSRNFSAGELAGITAHLETTLRSVGRELREHFGRTEYEIKHDDPSNWVTYWDEWAQEYIIASLHTVDASIGLLAEEGEIDQRTPQYWTVDPLDASNHYVRGNEFCTTMVALVDEGVPVASAIFDFVRGNMYVARAGGGAYVNGVPLQVSSRPAEQGYYVLYSDEDTPVELGVRQRIYGLGASMVQYCATGYTMASVARGALEGLISINDSYGHEWDVAPGALLVHEAGGVVVNVGTQAYQSSNLNFLATNQIVHNTLRALVADVVELS